MQAPSLVPVGPPVEATKRRGLRYVEVSTRVFSCVWLCAAVLHVSCGFYYFGVAYGYWIATPDTALARMMRFHKLGIDVAHYRTVAATHGSIGGVHAALLSYMVACSIRRRRFSFRSTEQTGISNTDRLKSMQQIVEVKPTSSTCWIRLVRCGRAIARVHDAVFGRKGILGVEGPYFDVQHLVLELVETALQSYQAYRMSQHVPRPWLNALLVGLIVVNCVCSPALHCVFGSNALARRATCLAIDAVLDLVSSVVVPSSLLILYSADYVTSSGSFKAILWFSDTWFVNASNEFQLMLVTSWGDLTTRVVVAVGFIVSLESAKSLLRPWLQTKPACALMLIDCERYNLTHATDDEIRDRYMISDLKHVVRLTIRHCPGLRVPSPLQSLRAVTAIKLYNSTIADWPREAALTSSHHPVLTGINLVRVVFPNGQLPAGLMDVDFPKHTTSILICKSNLETLPVELATRWPQRAFFLFEGSRFTIFPLVLMALNPIQISFAENQFTQFPFEALQISSLVYLNMGGNRDISSLVPPNGIVASKSLTLVNVANTNVSILPDWFDARLRLTVNSTVPQIYPSFAASGTPLCGNPD